MTTWKPEDGEMPDHVRKVLEKFDNRPVEDKPLPRLKLPAPLPVGSARLYRLKVTLLGTEPPVWRRIVVPTFMKLEHLHTVLQTFMGWKNAHAFEFIIDGNRFVAKGDYQFVDNMWRTESGYDADEYELSQLFKLGKTFTYIYDYGDRWEHEIVVEEDNFDRNTKDAMFCLEGEMACPPEDCGGPRGYANLLAILADPEHPEYKERLDWLGGSFNHDRFDPKEVNRRLGVRRPCDAIKRIDHDAERKKKKQERQRKKDSKKRNR